MKVEVCFSPALYPYYIENNDITVVIVDIFRASTTICAALNNGAKSIMPVASINEAREYKEKGYLVGAERNVRRCDFADFGNSPFDYTPERVKDKDIVFTTTNGTRAIEAAADCNCLVIGAFSNLKAITDFCISLEQDVVVLCAGWNNRFNIEDSLYGGALAEALVEYGGYSPASDASKVALSMWEEAKTNIALYINRTEHIKRLEANNLQDSVNYCLTPDTVSIVPIYNKLTKKITIAQ